ncbi:hypothetical protein GCM10010168_64840 [Actinoplanes ianthinogenes]|uniref:Lipoprotein n=1 Tax=Actinoplanes ianthinogenes TaxID=122358 RepID=A0ABM7LS95_9ACTN|nr:hypothetical protein [Actinoplanes ianthinogenes]BCJ42138.1 hypothetical protein Aiant_27950 [Actinoplanes ianthinogenes]GGR37458.1 hypothetical protein GCM10010168_64840 [Actinoplanes ianthinogenes]
MAGEFVVRGRILLPPGDRPACAARVITRAEDAFRADAPAVLVAEAIRESVPLPGGEGVVPFEIRLPAEAAGRCTLRFHVDVTGSGGVTAGDYVSTRSYPVSGFSSGLSVPLRCVE